MSALYYFAYGSNMHPHRLGERVPSSRFHGLATLAGHQLRWHKRGRDGSGKCDVLATRNVADRVIGVIYRLASAEKHLLDHAEGLGKGYNEAWQTFRLEPATGTAHQTSVKAFFYRADARHVDPALRPYHWYHRLVVSGAAHYRLPAEYQSMLATVNVWTDSDVERTQHHERLLAR